MTALPLRLLHLAAFAGPLAAFTYLLLVPVPPTPKVPEPWMTFALNKTVHAGGYAYLTVVGGLLFRTPRCRWGAVAFMLLHAIGTEVGQTFTGRQGCVQDVLIDWAGIAVGVLLLRRAFPPREDENPVPGAFAGSHCPAGRPE